MIKSFSLLFFILMTVQVFAQSENTDINTSSVTISAWSAKVYPNPNNGVFNIMVTNSDAAIDVTVFDVIGEKVFDRVILGDHGAKLDLSSFDKGLYFIQFIDAKRGETITKRIHIE